MSVEKPRCIYQLDGANGVTLNVAELPKEDKKVLLFISGKEDMGVVLDEEVFHQLSDLRYSLRFGSPQAVTTEPQLKVVASA